MTKTFTFQFVIIEKLLNGDHLTCMNGIDSINFY